MTTTFSNSDSDSESPGKLTTNYQNWTVTGKE